MESLNREPFLLVPAIDLKAGRCVRLRRGELGTETVYSADPPRVAAGFEAAGARRLHVVDLDGAFEGSTGNAEAIREILSAVSIPVQVGGGLRDLAAIERMLGMGVRWAILGTAALREPELLRLACRSHPGQIAVGVDAKQGKVAVSGWTEVTESNAVDLAKRLADAGASHLIYTDIERDGMMVGPNASATAAVARHAGIPVFASGGVSSWDDVAGLSALLSDGVAGVVVGKALYTGAIDLKESLRRLEGSEGTSC